MKAHYSGSRLACARDPYEHSPSARRSGRRCGGRGRLHKSSWPSSMTGRHRPPRLNRNMRRPGRPASERRRPSGPLRQYDEAAGRLRSGTLETPQAPEPACGPAVMPTVTKATGATTAPADSTVRAFNDGQAASLRTLIEARAGQTRWASGLLMQAAERHPSDRGSRTVPREPPAGLPRSVAGRVPYAARRRIPESSRSARIQSRCVGPRSPQSGEARTPAFARTALTRRRWTTSR